MKILHIGQVRDNYASGVCFSILGLAKAQVALRHKVAILPSYPPSISKEKVPKGIILLSGPEKRQINPRFVSREWIKKTKKNFGEPDIVNFHSTYILFNAALARQIEKEDWPYVLTPHGSLMRLAQKKKFLKKKIANFVFLNHFVKKAKAIFALCEKEAEEIRELFPKTKIFVLPNGVEKELFALEQKVKPDDLVGFKKEGDLVLCFIGRIDVHTKGIDLLLQALKKLQDNGFEKNIKLLLIGSFYTAKDKREVLTALKSLKFPENVLLSGPLFGEEKWKMLKASDVFIQTSRFDAMPVSILEAMAFKKPCIVTPGTNMQEIVSGCNGGWLCSGNADSIADVIVKVKKEKNRIVKKGTNAQRFIKQNLSWKIIAKKYDKTIKIL